MNSTLCIELLIASFHSPPLNALLTPLCFSTPHKLGNSPTCPRGCLLVPVQAPHSSSPPTVPSRQMLTLLSPQLMALGGSWWYRSKGVCQCRTHSKRVHSLGQEGPWRGSATPPSILARVIPEDGQRSLVGLSSPWGHRSGTAELHTPLSTPV